MTLVRQVDFYDHMGERVPIFGGWRECPHRQFDSEVTIEADRVTFKATCLDCQETLRGAAAKRLMERGNEPNND